jgi:hypothetical protein
MPNMANPDTHQNGDMAKSEKMRKVVEHATLSP